MIIIRAKMVGSLMQMVRCYSTVVRAIDKETTVARLDYFSKLLGITKHATQRKLMLYDELKVTTLSDIKDSFRMLDELGMDKTHIQGNIQVLAISAERLKQSHTVLSEFGFTPEVPHLIKYSDILGSRIGDLMYQGYLSSSVDPLNTIMDKLACPQSVRDTISSSLSCKKPEHQTLPLKTLRNTVLIQLLVHELELPENTVSDFVTTGKKLRYCSLVSILETIHVLKADFNVTGEDILKFPLLLTVHCNNLRSFKSVCERHQLDWRHVSGHILRVLLMKPKDLDLTCKYLIDSGIKPELISKVPSVLLQAPETVGKALAIMRTWPEFHIVRCTPRILLVLNNYKRADIRLRHLKKAGFKHFTLSLLLIDDQRFQKHMSCCNDKQFGHEISAFVAERLDVTSEQVFKALRNNPRLFVVSLAEVQETLAFLFRQGFSRAIITRAVPLLLHPAKKVAQFWTALPHQSFAQPFSEWQQSQNILLLLLYFVEKENCVHFQPVQAPSM